MGRNGVADLTSLLNIGEEYHTSERMVNVLFVYVVNCHNQPPMPCQPGKARLLLKGGKAKIIRMQPFTIQLLYGSSGYKQAVSLGVDTGTQHIGISATTEQNVLFEAEVRPRTDIQQVLSTRREYRRARRQRKTRYRQKRFLNRKKPQGWLAPSIQHRVDAHLKTIKMVHQLLPISKTTLEIAQFDIQKIRNPAISGAEYQQGPQLGFWNVREYVLFRDRHLCQWCITPVKGHHLSGEESPTSSGNGSMPNVSLAPEREGKDQSMTPREGERWLQQAGVSLRAISTW